MEVKNVKKLDTLVSVSESSSEMSDDRLADDFFLFRFFFTLFFSSWTQTKHILDMNSLLLWANWKKNKTLIQSVIQSALTSLSDSEEELMEESELDEEEEEEDEERLTKTQWERGSLDLRLDYYSH